mmetsp:Transcript_14836/g.22822  ORF Transcript_14836/g.22822 Transcript_14836/m.22822 type:complete len:262 (-) Transcript_14836:100-885(-)
MFNQTRRVAFTTHRDENAGVVRNKTTSVNSGINTPSTKKRTAFGDISNRKQSQTNLPSKSLNSTPARRIAFGDISNKKSLKEPSVAKQRNGVLSAKKSTTKTHAKTKNNNNILPARPFNATPFSKADTKKAAYKTPVQAPVEDVDFCSRRPFNPFDEYDSDDEERMETLSIYDSDEEVADLELLASKKNFKATINTSIFLERFHNGEDAEKLFLDAPTCDFDDSYHDFDSVMAQATNSSIDLSIDADIHILGCYPMDDLAL